MPFSAIERKVLLAAKGVGPTVITRLEQLGFVTLAQLSVADHRQIVEGAAALVGSTCWKNSPQARSAIQAAIAAAAEYCLTAHDIPSEGSYEAQAGAASELQELANLGPKSAAMLAGAGIESFEHLARVGSVAAYARVKRSGADVSLNLLWAIEGALTGISWKEVARERRTSLLLALEAHERGS